MRTVRYSVAMSLDGYIADAQGGYDWIVMDPDIDFDALFKGYDTILMGRKSWEAAQTQGGGPGMPGKKVWVFSRTLRQSDVKNATVSATPQQTVTELKKAPGKDIWLFGGGELFRSLLGLGLVDAIEVAIIPVVLGGGLPMLPSPGTMKRLRLVKHRVFEKTGTVLLNYEVT
jgi:dihydrofolate reductase